MKGAAPWDGAIPAADLDAVRRAFGDPVRPMRAGQRPAVVVVDMTRGFVDSTYRSGYGSTGVPAVQATARVLETARRSGTPIFFTKAHPDPAYKPAAAEWGRWRRPSVSAAPELPPGDVIVDELAPEAGGIIIHKGRRPSAFFGTPLVPLLIQAGIDTLVVTGMTTSGCVRATVVDAFQYGYHVLVPHQCVADRSQVSHQVTLFDLHAKYCDVADESEVNHYLTAAARP